VELSAAAGVRAAPIALCSKKGETALDRWIMLEPEGYLDIQAPEVTYFDPFTERRVDGLDAMQVRLAPMKKMKPPFTDPRCDMIDPKVQRHGDVALLTFNLVNYGKLAGAPERVLARWNSAEVYGRIGGTWKIIHSHWSFIQPELGTRVPNVQLRAKRY
jgi:ketosteroid isomerase-like protein